MPPRPATPFVGLKSSLRTDACSEALRGLSAGLNACPTTTTTKPMEALEIRLAACCFIQRVITRLEEAGWLYEAQCLTDDYDRGLRLLPELLMVRDDAERLAAVLEANQ